MFSWRHRILSVDSRLLLAFYGIVPVLMLVAAADALFFNYAIRSIFPERPEAYLWWVIVFNLPHIMASFVTYADREYLRAYKRSLSIGLLIAAGLTISLPLLFSPLVFFVVGAAYTMYHVLMQQYGISLMLLKRRPDMNFQAWKWLTIVGSSMIYAEVYFPVLRNYLDLPYDLVGTGLIIISAPLGLVFLWNAWRSDATRTAKWYFAGTFAMLYIACLFYHWGYLFFMFLIPRFVHDATAFTVYAVHDHNRNLVVTHNWLYRVFKPLHISPVILCLPLGIAIAWMLTVNQQSLIAAFFISIFAFLHYYMEAYMWRREAPHRKHLAFYNA